MRQKRKVLPTHHRPGTTLLDTVLALFVLGFMITIIGTLVTARETNRRILYRAQAAALADEQLNALRRLDVTGLSEQTNGSFIGVLYNAGDWNVVADSTIGHSSPNSLELAGSAMAAVSGRMQFPDGVYGDGTLEAKWRLAADSPAGAAFGYLFRSSDSANGYRLRVARTTVDLDSTTGGVQNVSLDRLVNGTATRIDSRQVTIAAETWYTLRVVLSGSNISLFNNGTQLGSGPFIDATYVSGAAALLGWGGAHAFVDDIQTTTSSTTTWNFDADLDLPAAWIRLGLNDLPDSTSSVFDDNGRLTLSVFPAGSLTATLKQASVTIEYLANSTVQRYTATGLIGRSGVGL